MEEPEEEEEEDNDVAESGTVDAAESVAPVRPAAGQDEPRSSFIWDEYEMSESGGEDPVPEPPLKHSA